MEPPPEFLVKGTEMFVSDYPFPEQYPVPNGTRTFKRGIISNHKGVDVLIDLYQLDQVIVALAHGNNLAKLKVDSIELKGQPYPLHANLLGYGKIDGCCWCSLLLDPDLYGHNPSDLTLGLEGLAIVPDNDLEPIYAAL